MPWLTVAQNIAFGLKKKEIDPKAIENLISLTGLDGFADAYPRQLSGGMRQKVALIRTLAFDPELLLLDEPFSAVDYQTRLNVSDEIHGIIKKENKTAILVTHDIAEAISMADRVLVFAPRPTRVQREIGIRLTTAKGEQNPIARRNAPEFHDYFNKIWKELNSHEA